MTIFCLQITKFTFVLDYKLRFTDFLNRIDLQHDYQTNSTTCRFEPSNFTFNVRMKVPFYNNLRMQQHNKYNTYNRE